VKYKQKFYLKIGIYFFRNSPTG